jgi:hypothetical protein
MWSSCVFLGAAKMLWPNWSHNRVGLPLPVIFPLARLMRAVSFHVYVRPGLLAKAQVPDRIGLGDGSVIAKPPNWVNA